MLPRFVQADPGPALPHLHGACSRGREEFHHQRQVSLGCCILCNCLIGNIFCFVLTGGRGALTTLFKTCSHVKSSLKEKGLLLSKCKIKRCLFLMERQMVQTTTKHTDYTRKHVKENQPRSFLKQRNRTFFSSQVSHLILTQQRILLFNRNKQHLEAAGVTT